MEEKNEENKTMKNDEMHITHLNTLFMVIHFGEVDAFVFLFVSFTNSFDLDGTIGKWTCSTERIIRRSTHWGPTN